MRVVPGRAPRGVDGAGAGAHDGALRRRRRARGALPRARPARLAHRALGRRLDDGHRNRNFHVVAIFAASAEIASEELALEFLWCLFTMEFAALWLLQMGCVVCLWGKCSRLGCLCFREKNFHHQAKQKTASLCLRCRLQAPVDSRNGWKQRENGFVR